MRHSRIGKARGVVGTGAARRMTRPGGKAASTSESGVPGSADLLQLARPTGQGHDSLRVLEVASLRFGGRNVVPRRKGDAGG